MRLIVGLLVIALGLASRDGDARAHSIAWHRDSNVISLPQIKSVGSSHSPLQRRSPGRSKGKKGASSSKKAASLPTPNTPQSGKLNAQASETTKKSSPASPKAKVDSTDRPSSSKAGGQAISEGKLGERGRSPERLEDTKPWTPPLSGQARAIISPSPKRSPSPLFKWSEPDIQGDGSRDNQGGARTPSDRSPSPSKSQSPVRPSIGDRLRSLTISPSSPTRSKSPAGDPMSPSTPLSERLKYLARLPSPPPRTGSPARPGSSHHIASFSERSQSPSIIPPSLRESQYISPQADEKFSRWIEAMRSMTSALKEMGPTKRVGDLDGIRTVNKAKEEAKRKRERADRTRAVAVAIGNRGRPTSPTTVEAMRMSNRDSERAVEAIKAQTAAQTAATFGLKGTTRHQNAVDYWKSSARQWMRAQSREAHHRAFATEHDARVFRHVALGKSNHDPDRGPAFMDAAESKKIAVEDAQDYYRRRKQYEIAKEAFSDANSSSDEEWPLQDTPRPSR